MRVKFKKYLATQCTDRKSLLLQYFKQSGYCCAACSKREKQGYYYLADGTWHKRAKYPSWKLISKNKKQWMEKPLIIKERQSRWRGETYCELVW